MRCVRVASGRDYDEAAPIKGLTCPVPAGGGAQEVGRLTIMLNVKALEAA